MFAVATFGDFAVERLGEGVVGGSSSLLSVGIR